jgi:uncharacterized protein YjdB
VEARRVTVALRSARVWRYAANDPTGDEASGAVQATTYALAPADTADGAYWGAFAPQAGRESTVALRRTAINRAVFTVSDATPVEDSDLWRLARTGELYTVTGTRAVPTARVILFDGETVERGAYPITDDVPEHTAVNVIVTPQVLNISVGTVRRLRATVTNAGNEVLPDRPVDWTSSDRNIVNVDAQGRAEAFGPGIATLTATPKYGDGTVVGTATVTVG